MSWVDNPFDKQKDEDEDGWPVDPAEWWNADEKGNDDFGKKVGW